MGKQLKARPGRPSPDEALAVAHAAAPERPPAKAAAADKAISMNLRLRTSSMQAIMDARRGRTIKQVIMEALNASGIPIAPADLEDRTPRRQV